MLLNLLELLGRGLHFYVHPLLQAGLMKGVGRSHDEAELMGLPVFPVFHVLHTWNPIG